MLAALPACDVALEACSSSHYWGREIGRLGHRVSGIRADYAVVAPSALACFEDDIEACVAHLRLPVTHRRVTRTTNLLERLFGEERRRLKIVPNGFGEKPVLKLISAL